MIIWIIGAFLQWLGNIKILYLYHLNYHRFSEVVSVFLIEIHVFLKLCITLNKYLCIGSTHVCFSLVVCCIPIIHLLSLVRYFVSF